MKVATGTKTYKGGDPTANITLFSGTMDPKASMGGAGGVTYSTMANIPKAKRTKLIQEAKPMVSYRIF